MLSYAGVELHLPSAEVAAFAEATLAPADCLEWPVELAGQVGPLAAQSFGAMPPEKLQVGRLRWPRGAARFATAHYVTDLATVKQIRGRVYFPYRPADLVVDDGTYRVTTSLWMLPPRPVQQFRSEKNTPYILTLVDSRYFWWSRPATIDVTGMTWEDLYQAIGVGLTAGGETVEVEADAIPAAYLTPPAYFTSPYEYLPPLLDAVAHAIGHRIVRDWRDGSVRAMNAASSRAAMLANLGQPWRHAAGGEMAIAWY